MDYNIITPQYVKIWQTPASVGERIVARILDYFIIFLWAAFWMYIISQEIFDRDISVLVFFLFLLIPAMSYSFLWETFNNGQTPGKMIMKIRVVRKDGRRPTVGNYFMRWILEIVDIDMSCVGLIVMICTHNTQRLGDLAAGTMVIKVDRPLHIGISLNEFSYARRSYKPSYPQVDSLSSGQIAVIEKALDTYFEGEQLNTLARKVAKQMNVTPNVPAFNFLSTVLHDYQYYATELV